MVRTDESSGIGWPSRRHAVSSSCGTPLPPCPLAVRLWQGAQEHHSAQPATCCGRVTCGRVTCGHVIWRSAGPPGVAACCVARTSQTLNNAPHPTPCHSPSLQPTRINPHGTGPVTRPGDLGQQPLHVLWQPRAAAQRPVVSEAPPTPGASERLPICRPRLLQCLAPRLLDQEPSTGHHDQEPGSSTERQCSCRPMLSEGLETGPCCLFGVVSASARPGRRRARAQQPPAAPHWPPVARHDRRLQGQVPAAASRRQAGLPQAAAADSLDRH